MLFYAYAICLWIVLMYLTGVLVSKSLHKLISVSLKNFHNTSIGPWESSRWLKLVKANDFQLHLTASPTSLTLIIVSAMSVGLRVAEGYDQSWIVRLLQNGPKRPTSSSNSGLILNTVVTTSTIAFIFSCYEMKFMHLLPQLGLRGFDQPQLVLFTFAQVTRAQCWRHKGQSQVIFKFFK